MLALLDINVLIVRVDPGHQFHLRARAWLGSQRQVEIATCPLTELGFLRLYGHPAYPGGPGSPEAAARDLAVLRGRNDHTFLEDSVSLMDRNVLLKGVGSSQLPDLYLFTLAIHHSASFVTHDQRIPAHLDKDGQSALAVIPQ